jgi:hypothetical protein
MSMHLTGAAGTVTVLGLLYGRPALLPLALLPLALLPLALVGWSR